MSMDGSKKKPGAIFTLIMYLVSLFMAGGVFALPVVFVALDLYLGPQFMTAYIDSTGMYSGWLADAIPWAFSIATTGFQYLLFVTLRGINLRSASTEEWLAIIFGVVVALMDSGLDLAGFTSLAYGPSVGIHIFPDDPSLGWKVLAAIIVAMCLLQEIILTPLYTREKKAKAPFAWPGIGIVNASFQLAGGLYDLFCQFARAVAVAGVLCLDVFLSYFFFTTMLGTDIQLPVALDVVCWTIAIGLTVAQFVLYFIGKEKADGGGFGGGGKFKLKLNGLTMIGTGLSIFDTVIDLSALTIMMYGPDQTAFFGILPDDASLAYLLLAGSATLMCARYESLMVAAFKHGFAQTLKGM